ncbi:MAG: phosphoribosyltransferase family protein [Planctomycetia bacterium]
MVVLSAGAPATSAGAPATSAAVPCRTPLPLCEACVGELSDPRLRCLRCGQPGGGERCRSCRGRCRDWDGIVVLGSYGGTLRQAVLHAKRPRGDNVAAALATLLHRHHAETILAWKPDIVVPVPMHWWRRVERGTSAADVMAERLGHLAAIPVRRLLRRTRATVMQNRLPFESRRANVLDAFAVGRGGGTGKRVLLVDDVVTTGGTLAACRRALSTAGAAAVHVAVVARADHGSDAGAERDGARE